MKKLFLTLVLLVGIAVGLFAQKLTYQAVVRDNNQQLVVNTAVKATVTITFSTGNPYTTEVNGSTNLHGLLSFEFGGDALNGRNWEGATIAVKVVNAATSSTVYVNDEPRPVSAVPYALSVNGQSIQNYLTEHHYVDQTELESRHYLTSDSAVITTMQGDIAALQNAAMDCNKVKDCIKDTLGKYTPTTDLCNVLSNCQFSGQSLADLLQGLTNQISDLQEQVDYLSSLPHGGGDTPAIFTCGTSKVKDVDNNEYNTVKIGSQCWTKENMKTTKYANSTSIDNSKMFNPGGSEDNVATFGKLYTWSAATRDSSTTYPTSGNKVQGICPAGWHVPSDAEWTDLTGYVNTEANGYRCNGDGNIANALSDATGWQEPEECCAGNNSTTLNKTGFSAVPAGRFDDRMSNIVDFGNRACFWSATKVGSSSFWYRSLNGFFPYVDKSSGEKNEGYSVRCLRDAGVGGPAGGNEIAGTTPSAPATMSCEQVMECMGDTLGKLNKKIVDLNATVTTQGAEIETLNNTVQSQDEKIDSLAHVVDSLSNLTPGGGDTPTEVADGQPCPGAPTVSDGTNTYNTVKIGSQCWMKENLRTNVGNGVYPKKNGQPVTGEDTVTYGRLYTWDAVTKGASTNYPANPTDTLVQGICPTGWHVPSDAEWDTLTNYVNTEANGYRCNGDGNIAKALASKTGWDNGRYDCNVGIAQENNNATGFSAVPAGYCFSDIFGVFGSRAYFWSATQNDGDNGKAWCRYLGSSVSYVTREDGSKGRGFSVRCLRDAGTGGGGTTPVPVEVSCEQVMECMGDTLGKLNTKIEAQGQTITTQGHTIDSLAHIVDSLSNLPHGGGDTPTAFTCGTSKVKDADLNEYNTVKIGNQCWMKENLRTNVGYGVYPKKNNGQDELSEDEKVTYGRLYTWDAMMNNTASTNYPESGSKVQGICPDGWHVPSNAEWDTLTHYVFNSTSPDYKCGEDCGSWSAQSNVSCIAKALSSTTGWNSNTSEGCNAGNKGDKANATSFSAVPAGDGFFGDFDDFGIRAYFWSATQEDEDNAWYLYLRNINSCVFRTNFFKDYVYSVRCLRD